MPITIALAKVRHMASLKALNGWKKRNLTVSLLTYLMIAKYHQTNCQGLSRRSKKPTAVRHYLTKSGSNIIIPKLPSYKIVLKRLMKTNATVVLLRQNMTRSELSGVSNRSSTSVNWHDYRKLMNSSMLPLPIC